MIRSLITLYKSPYNKKHFIFALYRFVYWKIIRLFKLKNLKYSLWGDRKIFINYDSFNAMWIVYNHIVDWEEFNLIKDYVKQDDQLADVGTNMGYYSIWMSKFVSGKGLIHSFEPDNRNFAVVQKNVALNKINNVKLNNVALSDIDGFLSFTVALDGENHISTVNSDNTIKVASQCFDTYCKENSVTKLAYVKVDVEGFEYHFLKGSVQLLSNKAIDILQLEINGQVKNSNTSVENITSLLQEYKYELCKYDVSKKELIPIQYLQSRENYFAVNDLTAINLRLKNN